MSFIDLGAQLGISVGLWALNKWVFNDDKKLPKPRPESIEFAQNTIGTPIPIVYGIMRVDCPVLAWAGLKTQTLATYGGVDVYEYGASMILIVGTTHWDATGNHTTLLLRMWFGDTPYTFSPALQNELYEDVTIDLGDHGGGGILRAHVEYFDGRLATQTLNNVAFETRKALVADGVDMTLVPGFRKQMVVGFIGSNNGGNPHLNLGENAKIPSISFEVDARGRSGRQLGFYDSNPAWVIYDLIIGPMSRIGYDVTEIDLATFEAAATTLATEEHGCSLVIYRDEDAPQIIADLCAQIDAVVFECRSTGKIKIKLIRKDYVVAALPVMTIDNTLERPQVTISSWDDTANMIEVTYTNRARDYTQDVATDQRLANATGHSNRVRSRKVNYPGCTSPLLALKLAGRELAQAARPLLIVNVKLNREFYALEIGDAIRAYWPPSNIIDKVFRVLEVDDGELRNGPITATLIEDVFDNTAGIRIVPPEFEP